jgi:hypothetical protein
VPAADGSVSAGERNSAVVEIPREMAETKNASKASLGVRGLDGAEVAGMLSVPLPGSIGPGDTGYGSAGGVPVAS